MLALLDSDDEDDLPVDAKIAVGYGEPLSACSPDIGLFAGRVADEAEEFVSGANAATTTDGRRCVCVAALWLLCVLYVQGKITKPSIKGNHRCEPTVSFLASM